MRVLILDNRDSFVFNLQHRFHEIGITADVVASDAIDLVGVRATGADAVCISPGPGHPNTAGISVELVRELSGVIPILGVCLGHQAIGVAFGGVVSPDGAPCHGRATTISHHGHPLFAGIPPHFEAGRYHSLAIEEPLPEALIAIASGDGIVMAIAHREHPTFGVQFHPESILTTVGHTLLANFVTLATAAKNGE